MAGEPPLLQSMTRVAPLPGSAFPEMLYLYNRFAMVDTFQVGLTSMLPSPTETAKAGEETAVHTYRFESPQQRIYQSSRSCWMGTQLCLRLWRSSERQSQHTPPLSPLLGDSW
jgi:hypothetical protein